MYTWYLSVEIISSCEYLRQRFMLSLSNHQWSLTWVKDSTSQIAQLQLYCRSEAQGSSSEEDSSTSWVFPVYNVEGFVRKRVQMFQLLPQAVNDTEGRPEVAAHHPPEPIFICTSWPTSGRRLGPRFLSALAIAD